MPDIMKVYSIFPSINGEVCHRNQGSFCTFIRFAGCTIACPYCDTKYANSPASGTDMSIHDIMVRVIALGNKNITITGGEPLQQDMKKLTLLIRALAIEGFYISIETSGEVPFRAPSLGLAGLATFVVDIKLGKKHSLPIKHYHEMCLSHKDYFKFVIGSLYDMDRAIWYKQQLQVLGCKARFAFSPMEGGTITAKELVLLIDKYRLEDVVLNIQLHKIIALEEDQDL